MDLKPWIVERRKVLFSHPRVMLSEDTVRLPNGRVVEDYLQISLAEHAIIIVRSNDGKFLVVRQYKHGPRAIVLTFPAGTIEPDEEPIEAARRELREETGLRPRDWRCFGRFVLNGNQGAGAAHLFLAEVFEMPAHIVPSAEDDLEEQQFLWFAEEELIDAAKGGQFTICSNALALAFAVNSRLWPPGRVPAPCD